MHPSRVVIVDRIVFAILYNTPRTVAGGDKGTAARAQAYYTHHRRSHSRKPLLRPIYF